MTDVLATKLRFYRTSPARGAKPKVERSGGDFGQGVIRGVAIITRGEALGHGEWIDQEFVAKVGERIKSAKRGVKMRFTHPSLSGDGLGTFLGRAKNGVSDGDKTTADIHFSKASHNTPDGDLAAYVMDLADEDPEAFGVSIVYEPDFCEEDRFATEHKDEDGKFRSPDTDNARNYPHARLSHLRAADVVDDPAANPDGLFRRGHEIAEEADALCEYALGISDKKPELQTLNADADRIAGFAARFLSTHNLEVRTKPMAETKPNQESAPLTLEQLNSFGETLLTKVDERITAALANKPEPKPSDVEVERKRCSEMFATAKNAGLEGYDKIAQEAIDKGLSVDSFKASITDRLIAQNGLSKDSGEPATDPDVKYRKEYHQQRAAFVAMGLTEKEYVIGCKINDGSELLAYVPKEDKDAA